MAAKLGGARAVREAAEATLAKDSAAFTMDGSFDFGFSSSPMRGWGDVDFATHRAHFTMLAEGESTEVVVDDGTVYNRAEDEDLWIMTDVGDMPSSFTHMQTLEPTSLLEQLATFEGTVRSLGEEQFEGETVKKFEVALEHSLGDSAEDEELAELMGGAPEEFVEVWIGTDGLPAKLIYRMKFEMSLAEDEDDESLGEDYSFEYNIAYQFSEWGKKVVVDVPDESELGEDVTDFDLSDLGEIPETSWPSNVPCGSGTRFDGCLTADPVLAKGSDCSAPGLRICLQPVGAIGASQVADLVEFFDGKYGVRIEVLPAIDVPAAALTEMGNRASTRELIDVVSQKYDSLDPDLEASFMVITPIDVWSEDTPEYPWVFGSQWEDSQDQEHYRWSVFSTFRMNPETYGEPADPAKWEKRIQTFMTKYVGTTYFHFEMTSDPTSPLYRSITGLSVLDKITQGLPPLETAPRR